ncbi:MAG TPA: ethyl tert-butyl ether degradation protein EthD [Burkholderiales bacterium]|nr:ethyl tert-butyl ether degradation protein EthD [Burkholderiales bacterium]
MSFCLFVELASGGPPSLAAARGLREALVHTAAQARDPFLDDGAPPATVLQLYFSELADLEAAAAQVAWPAGVASHEAMAVRRFARAEMPQPWCTYLVRYEGPAEDPQAWLADYLAHHPALMLRLPGIRELEVYSAIDWAGRMPGARLRSLQRNKVAFDSPAALSAALDSAERRAMRAHFERLPRFSGRVTHFPMLTRRIPGTPGPS